MKKIVRIFLAILMCCVCTGMIAGCKALDGYQGDYECVYISANGNEINISETYEYYTVSLDGKGNLKSEFELKNGANTSMVTNSKYKIEGTVLYETSDNVTNEYKIEDGVITLVYESQGMNFVARFEKTD